MLVRGRDAPNGNAREGPAAVLLRLRRDDRGVAIVIVAMLMIIPSALIGIVGLAVEPGLWYTIKRYNQSAADAAAISGAMEKAKGQGYSDICALAVVAAKANNFTVAGGCQSTCTSLTSGQMC